SMRGAANDLRNQAAAMGGNVIYACCRPDKRSASGNNTFVTQPLDHISSGTYKPDR
ncbi:DUF4156 domain-containing protein, partial [Escherichia sp. HC-CC]